MVAPKQPKDCYECHKPIAARMDQYVASFYSWPDKIYGIREYRIFYHLKCFLNQRGIKQYFADEPRPIHMPEIPWKHENDRWVRIKT